jgi:hypothetical protein
VFYKVVSVPFGVNGGVLLKFLYVLLCAGAVVIKEAKPYTTSYRVGEVLCNQFLGGIGCNGVRTLYIPTDDKRSDNAV